MYDAPARSDGTRILVDRIWPRGISKENAHVEAWMRELAPSSGLRTWFAHDPVRWPEFKKRFFAELDGRRQQVDELLAHSGTVTLVYASREERFNNAVALREYLAARRKSIGRRKAA